MKKHRFFLLSILIVSSLLVGCAGGWLKYSLFPKLGLETEESVMSLPFVLMADEIMAYNVTSRLEKLNQPTEPAPETTEAPTETTAGTTEPSTEALTEPETQETTEETQPTTIETVPETEPETEPVYAAVDESWFDDVLFIGDSRTVGLRDTARLGKADYFCAGSMSVFTATTWTCTDTDFYKQKLETVLDNNTYGKVYIHLGLNELGNNMDDIMTKYRELVELVQQKQPDAAVILQAVMSVTQGKATDPKFSLNNIQTINARIQELAVEKDLIFSDVNTWCADENGYLRLDIAYDGAHLYGFGYIEWAEWIQEDAGWYGIA